MSAKVKSDKDIVKSIMFAMLCGLVVGILFMYLRTYLTSTGQEAIWSTISKFLLEDISVEGSKGLGLFYIISTVFINAIQLAIIPLVLTSLILALNNTSDIKKLGRIAYKTVGMFFILYSVGCLFSSVVSAFVKSVGLYNVNISGDISQVATVNSVNPMITLITIVPKNIMSVFSDNQMILSVLFLAIVLGLCLNILGDKTKGLKKLVVELNDLVQFYLTFVIFKLSPIAIFSMLVRAMSMFGLEQLKSVAVYTIVSFTILGIYLFFGYGIFIAIFTKLNPIIFLKKMLKVSMFAFSVDSSGATLPLNRKTNIEELGVKPEIVDFVLPLGMTINMNGTAMMHIMATTFIATVSGYNMTLTNYIMVSLLAIAFSAGAPAVPQVGAVMLFTVLTGMGFTNETAMLTYSLVFAIKPLEMFLTSLNVMGDAATAVIVAHSENELDEDVYYDRKKYSIASEQIV